MIGSVTAAPVAPEMLTLEPDKRALLEFIAPRVLPMGVVWHRATVQRFGAERLSELTGIQLAAVFEEVRDVEP